MRSALLSAVWHDLVAEGWGSRGAYGWLVPSSVLHEREPVHLHRSRSHDTTADTPAPHLRVYARETAIAEKVEARRTFRPNAILALAFSCR